MKFILVAFVVLESSVALAQNTPAQVKEILKSRLQSPKVVTFQLQQYLMKRAPKLPHPTSAEQWTQEASRIRRHILDDVVYYGWPKAWVDSPPKFEDMGSVPVPPGKGYRLRKFRYEIVPHFYSTALLYEPEHLNGKVPAVLDVMGHFPAGKAMEFEQKLCINQALRGMIALNLEWLDMGELRVPGNDHWFAGDLDLVGANGVGIFYLAMRRGLDYLYDDPDVDRSRIAMTGLSGGGWQTIFLSSLDPRISVSIPVAGFDSLQGRLERLPGEPGDLEQLPTDLLVTHGYQTLAAMRAPRPTLLLNNAEDTCCFRAPLVKPYIYEPIKPFFELYGEGSVFQFHTDTQIAGHNYGRDNRQQAYRFLTTYFHLPINATEIPVGEDIKSYRELAAGVPRDNLTILGLAREFASEIQHQPVPSGDARAGWVLSKRTELSKVVRYKPVSVDRAWLVTNTNRNTVESLSYRLQMSNGLSATAIWIKSTSTPPNAPLTIVLNDKGKTGASSEIEDHLPVVADRVDRGEQVLVTDLLFTGDAAPAQPVSMFAEKLAAVGLRPLGMEAAQLIGIAFWAQKNWNPSTLLLVSSGIRTQVVSLVAGALEPHLFRSINIYNGMQSLRYLLDKPVKYEEAPDLFCLDLYKDFDIDMLEDLTTPTRVHEDHYRE